MCKTKTGQQTPAWSYPKQPSYHRHISSDDDKTSLDQYPILNLTTTGIKRDHPNNTYATQAVPCADSSINAHTDNAATCDANPPPPYYKNATDDDKSLPSYNDVVTANPPPSYEDSATTNDVVVTII